MVGAGLSGLTAAIELARRGYQATLIEASKSLGGRMRLYLPEILPTAVLDAELCALKEHGVELRLQTTLGTDVALADLLRDYQAVCLCTGPNDCLSFTASVGIDGTTLVTAVRGVFCGSAPGRESRGYSPVGAVADGLRVALSVDRFLKGESLTAGRDREGSYRSRLETSLQGVEAAPAVTPGEGRGGYTREQAVLEARRCLQCECLQCVTACTYLQHFREYPGKCIRKVTKNLISVPGKSYRTFTPFINACALCGLCGSVCPTDLDMAVVNGRARRIMCEQGVMPPAIHHFAIEDMESSNSAAYAFARNQPGWESSSHLFFPGCQLAASLPDKVVQTYQFLMTRLEGGVGMATGCCGAPAQWSGRELLYEQTTDALKEHWRSLGRPRLISACPTCLLMLQQGLPETEVVSLWEVLQGLEPLESVPRGHGQALALHDSCTARGNRPVQDAARDVLTGLGYQAEELLYSRETTKCCGYGGLMYETDPNLTVKVIGSRIQESGSDYATYCSNCRDFFAGQGKTAYHLLELLFDGYRAQSGPRQGPTRSERRANRRILAERMLAQLWGEEMPALPDHITIPLRLTAEIAAKMEREFILEDDVRHVIHHAERTGDKLACPSTGSFIAHYRPSLITYWVEYAPLVDGYEIFNVYCHRMQIVEDTSDHDS